MDNELLKSLLGLGGSALIVALTQIFKPFVKQTKFYPFISIGWGLLLNIGIMSIIQPITRVSIAVGIVQGLMVGLAAAGIYSTGATLREGNESNKNNRPT